MRTAAQNRAQSKYLRDKVTRKSLDIFPSEQDILLRLKEVKQNGEGLGKYIKRLIR
jgi:hypothetical protein